MSVASLANIFSYSEGCLFTLFLLLCKGFQVYLGIICLFLFYFFILEGGLKKILLSFKFHLSGDLQCSSESLGSRQID